MQPFVSNPSGGYALTLDSGGAINAVDATTYYFGSVIGAGFTTTANTRRIYIPKGGTIIAANVYFLQAGSSGTSETSTLSIRKNNTTDFTISSSITNESLSKFFSNNAMSVPVAAGDYIEMKWVTPTWATNPTSVRATVQIFIQT